MSLPVRKKQGLMGLFIVRLLIAYPPAYNLLFY